MTGEPVRGDPGLSPRPPDPSALRAALSQTRANIAILTVVLLVLVAGGAYLAFGVNYREAVQPDRYTDALRKQFADDVDNVVADAGDVAAEVGPRVTDVFYEQFKADAPEYARTLDTQGDALAEHLNATLDRKVRDRVRRTAERYRAVLKEELPEVTDPAAHDRIVADFERMLNALGRRYYVDDFKARLKETREAWRAVPPAESRPGDPPLEDRLATAAQDWVRARLTEERNRAKTPPPGGKP